MLPVRWRAGALDDLLSIISHVSKSDEAAAFKLKTKIEMAVLPLSEHPYLYRPGRRAGTRELVAHPNYIVVYSVLSDAVEVVSVIHARQKYP